MHDGNVCFDFFFSSCDHNIYILIVNRLLKNQLSFMSFQLSFNKQQISHENVAMVIALEAPFILQNKCSYTFLKIHRKTLDLKLPTEKFLKFSKSTPMQAKKFENICE